MILNFLGCGICSERKRQRRKVYDDAEMLRAMPTLEVVDRGQGEVTPA